MVQGGGHSGGGKEQEFGFVTFFLLPVFDQIVLWGEQNKKNFMFCRRASRVERGTMGLRGDGIHTPSGRT